MALAPGLANPGATFLVGPLFSYSLWIVVKCRGVTNSNRKASLTTRSDHVSEVPTQSCRPETVNRDENYSPRSLDIGAREMKNGKGAQMFKEDC